MLADRFHYPKLLNIIKKAGPFVLLALLIWIVHFWHSASFGLYEDDYNMVSHAMAMSGQEIRSTVGDNLLRFGGGKPLHATFIYTFAYIGERLGGLHGVYILGFCILALNAFLFYALLARQHSESFAALGALGYVLFSADTTQTFLTHSLGLQPSLTFILLATHCYLSDRRLLSYILVCGALLTYEVPYPVFFAAPLLREKWDKRLLKDIVKHALVLVGILSLTIALRYLVGEPRITNLSLPELVTIPIRQMVLGPYMSLRSYVHRPYQTLRVINGEIVTVVALATLFLTLVFSSLRLDNNIEVSRSTSKFKSLNRKNVKDWITKRFLSIKLPDELRAVFRLGFTGLVMLILAYPFTFTVSALAVSGRNTRVHFAAILGASILCACVSWLILCVISTYGRKWIGSFILACYFAFLVGYGFVVQGEYKLAWQYQQEFWTELLPLIPDLEEGTVILVDPRGLEDTIQIGANFWNLPRMLDQIYQFPAEWDEPPRVYRLVPEWNEYLVRREGIFQLKDFTTHAPPSNYKNIESSISILIENINGQWVRRTEPLVFDGIKFHLKERDSMGLPPFRKGFLFGYLIQGS